ncbi:MAG: diguanylate cyclase [Chloroflexota bacterium]|jgi:diguanylate cyclase (GGDEF)-like protein|nr:diguanylate cyclase [Chloroflexota bacterium]
MMEKDQKLGLSQKIQEVVGCVNLRRFLLILMAVILIVILVSMILSVNFLLRRYAVEFAKEGAQMVRDRELAEGIYTIVVEYVNEQIKTLSLVISAMMIFSFLILFLILNFVIEHMVKEPLNRIGEKARQISENHDNLGKQIRTPIFNEMQELTDAFNIMSTTLRQQMDQLEDRVQERTADLESAQEKIVHMAEHDSLTGLPNRRALNEQFEKVVGSVGISRNNVALLMIDLDNYKLINDQYGHMIGDVVLQKVSQRFEETLRDSDLVSRWGGDEFVILLHDVNPDSDIEVVLNKLFSAFEPPIAIDDKEFIIQMSLGIALYPQDGDNIDQLMRSADAALYRAKEEAGNSYRFYKAASGD